MLGRSQVEALDAAVFAQARVEAGLRLRLGQLLEVVGWGAHHELGFSSLSAYSLERCGRSARWVEAARCLARRLEALPAVRRALAFGEVSWSMAEPLCRVATREDEGRWLAVVRQLTVRQMRELVQQHLERQLEGARAHEPSEVGPASTSDGGCPADGDSPLEAVSDFGAVSEFDAGGDDGRSMRTLTCTVDREDSWLFEATRALLTQLGASGTSAQVEALLAEGQESLLRALPDGAVDPEQLTIDDGAQRRWCEQLARFREEAETRCESRLARGAVLREPHDAVAALAAQAALGGGGLASLEPAALDAAVREVSRALARHELKLSQQLLELHQADGWRRLGYATEAQYARERLGLSRTSVLAKRALALRLLQLPRIAEALGRAEIGVEAAAQLAAVATPHTETEWLARARQRTVKHLREEVVAAQTAVRLSGARDCLPPLDEELERFQDLERAVLSGQLGRRDAAGSVESAEEESGPGEEASAGRRPWRVMLNSLGEWLVGGAEEGAVQMSAVRMSAARPLAGVGRVRLRLRIPAELAEWWRGLEAQARRWLPRGTSWLRYLCLSVWRGWQHLLGKRVAYGGIYVRDRHRCTSPVCSRRDVTPHHLRFRSAGGGDEPDNVAAVCTWCHLLGIHERRIRAVGSAGRVRWELGRGEPCLVVEGRQRLWAS